MRTRLFSIDRYGFDGAYEFAVNARAEFDAEAKGYVGVTHTPVRFRPVA